MIYRSFMKNIQKVVVVFEFLNHWQFLGWLQYTCFPICMAILRYFAIVWVGSDARCWLWRTSGKAGRCPELISRGVRSEWNQWVFVPIDLWCDFECCHSVFLFFATWNDQILQSSSNILWTNIIIISYIYPPLKLTVRPVRPWNKDPAGISEIPNNIGKMLLVLGSVWIF